MHWIIHNHCNISIWFIKMEWLPGLQSIAEHYRVCWTYRQTNIPKGKIILSNIYFFLLFFLGSNWLCWCTDLNAVKQQQFCTPCRLPGQIFNMNPNTPCWPLTFKLCRAETSPYTTKEGQAFDTIHFIMHKICLPTLKSLYSLYCIVVNILSKA